MSLSVLSFSNSKKSSQEGFSLLELSIVLVVIGIIGGLTLPLLTAQMSRAAILKTRSHQDYALNAIAAYVEKNGRFPCPAEPKVTGSHYGLSQESCRGKKAKGILPFKTLGMSESYSKDGHKHLMTYVVEPQLTQRLITLQNEPGGFITVLRDDSSPVISPPAPHEENPNYVALVLVSHGKESGDQGFVFKENNQNGDILRWESRDQFLKHYVRFP
jgi:prepilin-type N-terminal cleavage/methylation domain-containing protein